MRQSGLKLRTAHYNYEANLRGCYGYKVYFTNYIIAMSE